ncbi:MAG: PQQ-like beta-propeller repeat protein [Phycisphaerae bacterium]|nr:PQQ-like beta-propeller repeat protein [Phycisphaerae bacterium]
MRPLFAIALVFGVLALVSLVSAADAAKVVRDWPQWRGPLRDGRSIETRLLRKWPEEGPPLAWKAEGLGMGYSSVSIVGNRIFTMGDKGKDQLVIALDLATREPVWTARVGEPWGDGGPRGTPTVDGERVYALGAHGDLVCLAMVDGKEIWRKSLKKDFGGKMMSGWGYSESPLVDGDKLVCTPGGDDAAIAALDKKTGETIWTSKLPSLGPKGNDGAGYSSLVVSQGAGVRQYVQLMGRGAVSVAADDGRFLWCYNRIASDVANVPTCIVDGDFVFATASYENGSGLLKLSRAPNKGVQATEVYYLGPDKFENHHGGVILVKGFVYGGHGRNNGSPTCIDFKTGKIMWQAKGIGRRSAAITYADGHLYFRYEDGLMALIEANPRELRVAGTFKIPTRGGPSWPHPVVADGKLYIRHEGTLLCYDIKAK